MHLYMLKIGARPHGRLIEQHDVMFVVANSLSETIDVVNQHWPEVKGKWHLDAWRVVNRVGDYHISLMAPTSAKDTANLPSVDDSALKLYFINLGGYLPNQFEEFHYKTLVVADSVAKATAQVKKSAFYRDYTFSNAEPALDGVATSHVDDKHALEVDEIHSVAGLLPNGFKLVIRALNTAEKLQIPDDHLHIGYLSLKQIRSMV